MKPQKFKVQLFDFSCEGLVSEGPCDPYLKIDFDNAKAFKTSVEIGNTDPEWSFRAGFTYELTNPELLAKREIRVQCFKRSSGLCLGEARVDILTVACGPTNYRLTLLDTETREPRGLLKFTCVMKLFSPNLTVVFKDLSLTMQGCPAPAKLNVNLTLTEENSAVIRAPHNSEGLWPGPFSLVLETSLADLLKAPAKEYFRFEVIDDHDLRQGEAELEVRKAFSLKGDALVPFRVPVTYTSPEDGEARPEWGAVGELTGVLQYQNLPGFAQLSGGAYVDGQVEGAFLLLDGLPYPACLSQSPPLWQEPDRLDLLGDFQPGEDHETRLDDVDQKWLVEALDKIDLPPGWEKRRERDRQGRTYFADLRSRRTTWKDPRFLPENWDQRLDPTTGKIYFTYHRTRQTTYVDPRGCPAGWDMRLSKTGLPYFAYLPAMQTTFVDPRGLPENIEAALDDFGRMYFKNHETKTTTWEDPRQNQTEVTLTQWRNGGFARWWREQAWREIEEMARQRTCGDDVEEEDSELPRL